jgi:MFS family permease
MRKATLGTLFLTVFLDLVGFGLVIPFLPAMARDMGGSDFLAAALASSFSLMQFLFVPLWGRLSDRIGRRPVLLWSIAGSAAGMFLLGLAQSLPLLFLARMFSGFATANIAVAQAYIADITLPENRAKGMAVIGIGFGLGFMIGPFIGGELGRWQIIGHQGTLPSFVAAGLSTINLLLALRFLPESLAKENRSIRKRVLIDWQALRDLHQFPGVRVALFIFFCSTFWFAGVQALFRLFTLDAFQMNVTDTGRIYGLVGLVSVLVQGGLIGRLNRRFGEIHLITTSLVLMAVGFLLHALSVKQGVPVLLVASILVAVGTALHMPSVSSYVSRSVTADAQGATLGLMQSGSALARATGPVLWGVLYDHLGLRVPFVIGAAAFTGLLFFSPRLPKLPKG